MVNLKNKTVVLIHGLWESPLNLRFLGSQFHKAHYRVEYFSYYPVNIDHHENTDKLSHYLDDLGSEDLYLVGHSLGGLLILDLLNRYRFSNIQRSVIFGSPVNGSIVARNLGEHFLAKKLLGKSSLILGKGVVSEKPNNIGVIAGSGGKGVGQFFADLPKPQDGTVAVSEAILENCEDFVCLPVSHFTMLFSKQVAREMIEFFDTGCFNN